MSLNDDYKRQAQMVIQILPFLNETPEFALKGGTAINLFFRELARLSVDIDLCYLPLETREATLRNVQSLLKKLKMLIEMKLRYRAFLQVSKKDRAAKLIISGPGGQVKIEPNYVLRGSVYEPAMIKLSATASAFFSAEVETLCLSFEDTFAGKLCAALSRQHPRDLFDVKLLLDNEGLTENLRKAFLVYLCESNRPLSELLAPNQIDVEPTYNREFKGMENTAVSFEELIDIQSKLPKLILNSLTCREKSFLYSFKLGEPDWSMLGLRSLADLPGIQWKLRNIQSMKPEKHREALQRLKEVLFLTDPDFVGVKDR